MIMQASRRTNLALPTWPPSWEAASQVALLLWSALQRVGEDSDNPSAVSTCATAANHWQPLFHLHPSKPNHCTGVLLVNAEKNMPSGPAGLCVGLLHRSNDTEHLLRPQFCLRTSSDLPGLGVFSCED